MKRDTREARQLAMMELAVVHGKANNVIVAVREFAAAAAELSRPRFDSLDQGLADTVARLVVAACPNAAAMEHLTGALALLAGGCREAFHLKEDQPLSDAIREAEEALLALQDDAPATEPYRRRDSEKTPVGALLAAPLVAVHG